MSAIKIFRYIEVRFYVLYYFGGELYSLLYLGLRYLEVRLIEVSLYRERCLPRALFLLSSTLMEVMKKWNGWKWQGWWCPVFVKTLTLDEKCCSKYCLCIFIIVWDLDYFYFLKWFGKIMTVHLPIVSICIVDKPRESYLFTLMDVIGRTYW